MKAQETESEWANENVTGHPLIYSCDVITSVGGGF